MIIARLLYTLYLLVWLWIPIRILQFFGLLSWRNIYDAEGTFSFLVLLTADLFMFTIYTVTGILMFAGLVHGVFEVIETHTSISLSKFFFVRPWKLLQKLGYAITRGIITIFSDDKFIFDFGDIVQEFDSIWLDSLLQEGFVAYRVQPYTYNTDKKPKTLLKRKYVRDTLKGYHHIITLSQEVPGAVHLQLAAIPSSGISDHNLDTQYIEYTSGFGQEYIQATELFRKESFTNLFSTSYQRYLTDNYFGLFPELPKPFDTISPAEILQDNALLHKLVNITEYSTQKLQLLCLHNIYDLAVGNDFSELKDQAIQALENFTGVKFEDLYSVVEDSENTPK